MSQATQELHRGLRRSARTAGRRLGLGRVRWRAPVLGWLGVAVFNLVTLAYKGTWTGHAVAMQWWVSVDNVIPEKTARWFLGEPFIPGVYTFDRGPLQPLLLLWGGEWSTNPTPALITGVIVNSAWAIGLWSLLRVLRISEQRIAFVIVLVALTGPVWFNTLYVWPKMLAAALCLGCAAAVLSRRPLWAGVLAGLALLAHGTALFAIVGLLPWMVMKFRWKTIAVLGIASLFYAPWYVASLFVASTGQPQMIQWHFGGTDIGTPDLRSPLLSVIDAYRQAGLAAIGNKINNFRVLLGDPRIFRQEGGNGWFDVGWPGQSGWLGQARWLMSSHLALAPGVLLGGLFWARGISRTLWMLAGAWFLVYGILEWGGSASAASYLHTAPFALLIVWVTICVLRVPAWFLAVQIAFFALVWLMAPPVWPS